VRFIIDRDPKARFSFGALQSVEADALLKDTPVRPEDLGTVVYLRNGQPMVRSTAALHILKDLGGAWALLFAFIVVPPFLRDAVYRWIARNRYRWFGQRESCMVPTPELRARFLDGLKG
jgi:predicted DCC family thiol-disulfide oxidoreductase YuxK